MIRLLSVVQKHEKNIIKALNDDFKKSEFEAVVTETSYVISDLNHTIKNLKSWSRPKTVMPSLLNFPSTDKIYSEPFGKVLVIAPWNYPFMLAMSPLIAAVAAGNQVILKPSELTPNTASIIEVIVVEAFHPMHVEVYHGGAEATQLLLERKWDLIFFTGSVRVGTVVAKAAAENLTPVILELGGKSPCIVGRSANLEIAAKRIVWGKFLNAGQTCLAPDYILADHQIKEKLIAKLIEEIKRAYGDSPELSPDFPRIISEGHFDRLINMIDHTKVVFGGTSDRETKYISPTIIDEPEMESGIMAGEIFGPLLPVLSFKNESDIENVISKFEKPLSLYVFSEDKSFADRMINKYPFGGGCINDTVIHFSNRRLPFGGVGQSGMGSYHGKSSFDAFSHKKSIVRRPTWLDIPLRYAPYSGKLSKVKKLLNWFN